MRKSIDEIELYKAYIRAKADKYKTVTSVAEDFGLTRRGLYDIVARVEKGDTVMLKACTEQTRLDCLWKYKYSARFFVLPNNRKKDTVAEIKKLVIEMDKDGFPPQIIALNLQKDRTTILHHLK